jgi:hypothetical protein
MRSWQRIAIGFQAKRRGASSTSATAPHGLTDTSRFWFPGGTIFSSGYPALFAFVAPLGYGSAIDGLRFVVVLLCFHVGFGWMAGG